MINALATKTLMGRLDTGETGITAAGTCDTVKFDCVGYDYASIDVLMGTANVVSNKPSVFKLQEGDSTSSMTDVSGFVGGTDWTIPNALTDANNIYRLDVDLRARKRYLMLVISPRTTQEIAYNIRLSRAEAAPTSTTATGVLAMVRG